MASNLPQVFISYQRADGNFARSVREHLVEAGVKTRMDQYDIPVGSYWPDEIDTALAASEIVGGILSPDAVDSRNVKNEWDWAIQNEKRLLLLQYRSCVVPHRYVSINFIDASGPDPLSEIAFAALLDSLGVANTAERADIELPSSMAKAVHHGTRRGSPARRREQPFMVGRAREQDDLRERLDELGAGQGCLVLLSGEAGIGKTTLTNWLAWAAQEQGALVVTGGCFDLRVTPPYGPWGRLTGDWPDDPTLLAMPVELREGTGMGKIRIQTEFIALFDRFLADASAVRPLLLLLEDFHWADQASLDVLRGVARTVADKRVFIVVTYRDDELTRRHPLNQALPMLVREAGAHRLTLSRLAPEATRELLHADYKFSASDTEKLGVYVHRLAEGNPLFSGEILRVLEEAGALRRDNDIWRLGNLERVQVPPLVRQVIETRLERLGDNAHHLLQVAAVIGHEFPIDLWVAVSGAGEEQLSETLELATEARLIEEIQRGTAFRFTHALIRETLYESLVSLRRRRWHRTVAEALEVTSRTDPDIVAHHYQQANDPRAYAWLIKAGKRAMDRFAWRAAAERWEAAVALMEADEERSRDLGWLLFLMGTLLRYASRERALDYLTDAHELGQKMDDRLLIACARAGIGFQLLFSGRGDRGLKDLIEGVSDYDRLGADHHAALPAIVDREFLAVTMENRRTMQVAGLVTIGRHLDALRLSDELLSRLKTIDLRAAHAGTGNIFLGRGLAFASLGQADDAADAYARARDHLELASDTNPYVFGIAAFFLLHTVELPFRADQTNRLRAIANHGFDAWITARDSAAVGRSSRIAMLGMLLVQGEWEEARVLTESGVADEIMMVLWDESVRVLGVLSRNQGQFAQAWEQVARYFPNGPESSRQPSYAPIATAMQRLAVALALDGNDLPLARAWLTAHDDWLEWSGVVVGRAEGSLMWARYHQAQGDRELALQHVERSLEQANAPRQPLSLLTAHRVRGELATQDGDFSEAERQLHASLALADACAAPFERALTLLAPAELDAERGDVDAAQQALAEAHSICQSLAARPTLERVAVLQERLAVRNIP